MGWIVPPQKKVCWNTNPWYPWLWTLLAVGCLQIAGNWISVSFPARLICESLNGHCDDLWKRGIWEVIKSLGWSLIQGISVHRRRDTRDMITSPLFSLYLQCPQVISKPGSVFSPDTGAVGTLILDFPVFRTERNKCLFF